MAEQGHPRPLTLVIGNYNYSSWSLRAWLVLAMLDVDFETVRIPLDTPETAGAVARHSPAGRVPVLIDGSLCVWDSLAIGETVSERYANGRGWPADAQTRARARAVTAEMHAGFGALRTALPMNCRARDRLVALTADTQADIRRIDTLWSALRAEFEHAGPWLFGTRSIADCFYAPIASRFRTYGVELSASARAYVDFVLSEPVIAPWLAAARDEAEVLDGEEVGRR